VTDQPSHCPLCEYEQRICRETELRRKSSECSVLIGRRLVLSEE
jgi:hypothetical protein